MKGITASAVLLVFAVSVAWGRLGSSRVTPETVSQHGIVFAITAPEKNGLHHFSVTLSPQEPSHALPSNLVATLTIHDAGDVVFRGELQPKKHGTSQTYSFSISPKSAVTSQLVLVYASSPPNTPVVGGHVYTIDLADFVRNQGKRTSEPPPAADGEESAAKP